MPAAVFKMVIVVSELISIRLNQIVFVSSFQRY